MTDLVRPLCCKQQQCKECLGAWVDTGKHTCPLCRDHETFMETNQVRLFPRYARRQIVRYRAADGTIRRAQIRKLHGRDLQEISQPLYTVYDFKLKRVVRGLRAVQFDGSRSSSRSSFYDLEDDDYFRIIRIAHAIIYSSELPILRLARRDPVEPWDGTEIPDIETELPY